MANALPTNDSRAHRERLVAAAGGARDLAVTARVLGEWFTARIGAPTEVTNLHGPEGAGIANETWLLDARTGHELHRFVLRVKPKEVVLFPDPDFDGLFRLLDLLHREQLVRVPEVLWLEEDEAVLGAPFLVMRMFEGRVPVTNPVYTQHGWVAEATPEQRRTFWTTAVDELARIHCVPGELVSFIGWPQYGETGEDQQLGYWDHYRDWSRVPETDDMIELREWIGANRPHEPGIALSWGDARPGNMIFGPDFRLLGVLDWDQMSLASPRHDLSWWLLFDELNTTGRGIPRPEGIGSREETIERWEAITGQQVGDLSWHTAFTTWKLGLITLLMMLGANYGDDAAHAAAASIVGVGRRAAGLE